MCVLLPWQCQVRIVSPAPVHLHSQRRLRIIYPSHLTVFVKGLVSTRCNSPVSHLILKWEIFKSFETNEAFFVMANPPWNRAPNSISYARKRYLFICVSFCLGSNTPSASTLFFYNFFVYLEERHQG